MSDTKIITIVRRTLLFVAVAVTVVGIFLGHASQNTFRLIMAAIPFVENAVATLLIFLG